MGRGSQLTADGVHMGQLSFVLMEVLPMASDLLAVLSFMVFALMKLLPCLSPFPAPLIRQKTLWTTHIVHSVLI